MRVRFTIATVLVLLGCGLLSGGDPARAAGSAVPDAPVPGTPSAKRMVLDRQVMLVAAFARYIEQQIGVELSTPIGHGITLELGPRAALAGAGGDVLALQHGLGAAPAGGPGPARMSAALSGCANRLKLTFRLRW
jgi:hypothetical protein